MSVNGLSVTTPRIADVLQSLKANILQTLNCVKVGAIVAVDRTKMTATVQVAFKRVLVDGQTVSYPVLVDCPLYTPRGGQGALTFPIASGDECLLLFSDQNLDAWYLNGGQAPPMDSRRHDLSDCIALVGLSPLSQALPATADLDESALSEGAGAVVAVKSGRVSVRNGATTLLEVINGLISVLQTIAVTDETGTWPLNAASIAALEAYKLQVQALLY